MFLNDPNFPISVLQILPEKGSQRGAWFVPTYDAGRLPDPATSSRKPQIKLIILITDQFLVEQPHSAKDFAPPAPKKDGVEPSFIVWIMSPCTSNGKRGVECSRNGLPHESFAFRNAWATDIIGTGLFEYS
jgi:hypothetical protein